MKSKIFYLIGLAATLSACEKTVELDVTQTQPKIVIEGQVTDKSTHNYVKVSRTTGFYSAGNSPRISDATVSVEDNLGNIFMFEHYSGQDADSIGYYKPLEPFEGVVGRSYTLTVMVDGESYEATDTLYRLVEMEKLDYRINEDEKNDPEDPGRFYELLLYVKEPKETKDYYLFKSFRNGNLEYANETDIYFADDELIGENIDGIPLPLFYAENDIAKIEVYSLSRSAFIFYRDLQKLLNNDGGMFGTPPANPRSNLSNGALGLFQTSAVRAGEMKIGD